MPTYLKPKSHKYAFTTNAFITALNFWGEDLFRLPGKLIVVEGSLLNHPLIREESIATNPIAALVYKHWFDIMSPISYGLNQETQEWQALERLQSEDPDNIYLCVDTINELAYFNRVYSNDELLNIADLGNHFV